VGQGRAGGPASPAERAVVCVGDLNCDGHVSFGDINPFVLFLSNFAAWQAAYPSCDPRNGDINGDGSYPSFGDINPFVALLSSNPLPLPCPAHAPFVPSPGQSDGERASTVGQVWYGVYPHSGEFTEQRRLLFLWGRGLHWDLTITYRSGILYDGPLGKGWDCNQDIWLYEDSATNNVHMHPGCGRDDVYTFVGLSLPYQAPPGSYDLLEKEPGGTFKLTDPRGTVTRFNAAGLAASITHRTGNAITYTYSPALRLTNVTDTLGRVVAFSYDPSGRITTVTDPEGRVIQFSYDAGGRLEQVREPPTPDQPAGRTTRFTYEGSDVRDPLLADNLLSIEDGKGQVYLENVYDAQDRVISQRYGPPGSITQFAYLPGRTTVTDQDGYVVDYDFDGRGLPYQITQHTHGVRPGDPPTFVYQQEHNANAELTRLILPRGNSRQYVFDDANPDPRQRGNLLEVRNISYNPGDPVLTNTYTYEARHNLPKLAIDSRGQATKCYYDYEEAWLGDLNGDGLTTQEQGNLVRAELPTAYAGQPTPQPIVRLYWYDSLGNLVRQIEPDGEVVAYGFWDTGPGAGMLRSVTQDFGGLNLTTEYGYNARGDVLWQTDPGGNTMQTEVNALGQVTRTIRPAPFNYEIVYHYDANGSCVSQAVQNVDESGVLDPNMPWILTTYEYDILNHTTACTEQVGPGQFVRTDYAYNVDGLCTWQRDPLGHEQVWVYDERDLLYQHTRGYGSSEAATVTTNYDGNRNLTQRISAEGYMDQCTYDGYDRLINDTDPAGNQIVTQYDGLDLMHSVAHFNAGGDVLRNRIFFYDEAGRIWREDQQHLNSSGVPVGDGWATTTWQRDRCGRPLIKTFDDGSQMRAEYDGAGRVTAVIRPGGPEDRVDYQLNALGSVVLETRTYTWPYGPPAIVQTLKQYDTLQRLVRQEPLDGSGSFTEYGYNSRGLQTLESNALGTVTRRVYDGLGRETEARVEAPTPYVLHFVQWDDDSRPAAQLDANGNPTITTFDTLDRLAQVTYADGSVRFYGHDRDDRLVSRISPTGTVESITPDYAGRPLEIEVARGPGVGGPTHFSYAYDGLGRLVWGQTADAGGPLTSDEWHLDTLSNLDREVQCPGGMPAPRAAQPAENRQPGPSALNPPPPAKTEGASDIASVQARAKLQAFEKAGGQSQGGQRACNDCWTPHMALGDIGSVEWGYMQPGDCGYEGKWYASFNGHAGMVYHWDLCPNAPGYGQSTFDADIKICDYYCNILAGVDGLSTCLPVPWNPNDFQWTCPAEGIYYVVIAPYPSYNTHTCNGTPANTFMLNYYATGNPCQGQYPPNDTCEQLPAYYGGAIPTLTAGVPHTFTGDNTCAQPDCAEFPAVGGNVWEAFTLTGSPTGWDVTLDYCGSPGHWGQAWLNLMLTCPCDGITPAASPWGWSCPDGNVSMTWAGLVDGTYYYPVYNDPAYGAIGPYMLHVTATVHTPSYCAGNGNICDEFVSLVQVGTINNASGCTPGGYADYTAISTDMTIGTAYPITVNCGPPTYTGDQCRVWVDWNNNLSWYDAGEAFTMTGNASPPAYFTGVITPPAGATLGNVRMRVRITYTGALEPCGTTTYGEVEDYTINVSAAAPACAEIVSTFDGCGNQLTLTYPGGSVADRVYDAAHRLAYLGFDGYFVAHQEHLGRSVVFREYGDSTTLSSAFDGQLRRLGMTHSRGSDVLAGFDYAYDVAGRKKYENRHPDLTGDAYHYNEIGEFLGAKYGVPDLDPSREYEIYGYYAGNSELQLDHQQNRITRTDNGVVTMYNAPYGVWEPDPLNRYTWINGVARSHDANGNLTFDGSRTFVYDNRNLLVSVYPDNLQYQRDCIGRIAGVTLPDGTQQYRFYDREQCIEERDAYGNSLARYVWGQELDELLVMARGASRYYFHADDLGSARLITDGSYYPVEKYTYDAYGQPSFFHWGPGGWEPSPYSMIGVPYLFTRQRYEAYTGLYDYRTRTYDPQTGRYLQPDGEQGLWQQYFNRYGYGDNSNDYVNHTSPYGTGGAVPTQSWTSGGDTLTEPNYEHIPYEPIEYTVTHGQNKVSVHKTPKVTVKKHKQGPSSCKYGDAGLTGNTCENAGGINVRVERNDDTVEIYVDLDFTINIYMDKVCTKYKEKDPEIAKKRNKQGKPLEVHVTDDFIQGHEQTHVDQIVARLDAEIKKLIGQLEPKCKGFGKQLTDGLKKAYSKFKQEANTNYPYNAPEREARQKALEKWDQQQPKPGAGKEEPGAPAKNDSDR
jgi:RHS repeat-associated protein